MNDELLLDILNESDLDDNLINLLLESSHRSVDDYTDEANNRLIHLWSHMLKYIKQPQYQTKSWVETILRDSRNINDIFNASTNAYKRCSKSESFMSVYRKAIDEAAKDTKLPKSIFPATPPWSIDEVIDNDFIMNFLYTNRDMDSYGHTYVEDLYVDYVEVKDSKNNKKYKKRH